MRSNQHRHRHKKDKDPVRELAYAAVDALNCTWFMYWITEYASQDDDGQTLKTLDRLAGALETFFPGERMTYEKFVAGVEELLAMPTSEAAKRILAVRHLRPPSK